jgi:hypothetical protein
VNVTSTVEVSVTITLTTDVVFEAISTYGRKRRPVAIDKVKVTGGSRSFIVGSGARINKDGSRGGLRASYVPLRFEQLPTEVRVTVNQVYADAVQATEEWQAWP